MQRAVELTRREWQLKCVKALRCVGARMCELRWTSKKRARYEHRTEDWKCQMTAVSSTCSLRHPALQLRSVPATDLLVLLQHDISRATTTSVERAGCCSQLAANLRALSPSKWPMLLQIACACKCSTQMQQPQAQHERARRQKEERRNAHMRI